MSYFVRASFLRLALFIAEVKFHNAQLKAAVATTRNAPEIMEAWERHKKVVSIQDRLDLLKDHRDLPWWKS